VALRATGQLIGDCAAMTRADDPGQCEIGFTIAPRYQGRGYATEAVRLLVGYLFARGKHRITACCDARQMASAAVLERLAMRREGLSMMVRRMERVLGSVHGMLWGLVPPGRKLQPVRRAES
jgi:RimJ/RimL family protein N-acetyltransferase